MKKNMEQDLPICQSCGMPMTGPEDFGVNADGSESRDYCQYCWQDGKFTNDVELPEFIDEQVKIAVEKMGMDETEAREVAQNHPAGN